ncbi:MAG: DUF3467 domain-containing protein [Chloroflexota bacterium]|jgi:hypothetical protein
MPVNIELPPDLEAIYSNFALITHSPSEVVIDFARILPNTPRAKVYARIIMTPLHAKLLLRALGENLSKYEGQFGEINIPEGGSLADSLFRFKPPGE